MENHNYGISTNLESSFFAELEKEIRKLEHAKSFTVVQGVQKRFGDIMSILREYTIIIDLWRKPPIKNGDIKGTGQRIKIYGV